MSSYRPASRGHWLEVAVVSFAFAVPDRRHPVFLPTAGPAWVCPCPPGGDHTCTPAARAPVLDIPVTAPPEPGSGQIRVAVYFAKNLVQSLMLTAEVAAAEEPAVSGPGLSAVVDFTLTTGLTGVAALPARTLNILTNDDATPTATPTHTIVFNGDQDEVVAFRLTEGQMTDAIGAVRAALRDIHLEEYGGGSAPPASCATATTPGTPRAARTSRPTCGGWRPWAGRCGRCCSTTNPSTGAGSARPCWPNPR